MKQKRTEFYICEGLFWQAGKFLFFVFSLTLDIIVSACCFAKKKELRCYTRYTPARLIMTWTGERANFLFSCAALEEFSSTILFFALNLLLCFRLTFATQHFNGQHGYLSRVNRSPTKMNRWTVTQDFSISFHRTFLPRRRYDSCWTYLCWLGNPRLFYAVKIDLRRRVLTEIAKLSLIGIYRSFLSIETDQSSAYHSNPRRRWLCIVGVACDPHLSRWEVRQGWLTLPKRPEGTCCRESAIVFRYGNFVSALWR